MTFLPFGWRAFIGPNIDSQNVPGTAYDPFLGGSPGRRQLHSVCADD
ncbi:hypothetical protein [Mycolicibacterium moriokaense]|nr:hypothetical protein [Mycolicibacterium moriokaense]